jgi:hypothetical protein
MSTMNAIFGAERDHSRGKFCSGPTPSSATGLQLLFNLGMTD